MLRLALRKTFTKSAIGCARCNQTKCLQSTSNRLYLSRQSSRGFSANRHDTQGSDALMYVAGGSILIGSAAFAYYAIDTQYSPETKNIVTEDEAVDENIVALEEVSSTTQVEDSLSENVDEVSAALVEPIGDISGIPYVIIGAGTAAHAACRAIRKTDPKAKILVVGEESFLPYMRPPLSKELWFTESDDIGESLKFKSWDGKERSVFFEEDSYYSNPKDLIENEDGGVAVVSGKRAVSVDAEKHTVTLSSGDVVTFDKLLIATGGRPRTHPSFDLTNKQVSQHTTLFRDVKDFQSLEKKIKKSESVVVVGGGFLGSELACALAAKGQKANVKVTQLYAEEGNMAKVLPRYLSEWTTRKMQNEGVNVVANRTVKTSAYENGKMKLQLDNDEQLVADHVIVCVGIEPNTQLASSAGLEIDPVQGGYRVNSELEARSDIWVAGDAACFYDINLGRRRVEHHDHAVVSGRLAGENMTGAKKAYKHQSMFWSDLGPEVGYEAIGIVDSSLPTVGVWAKATPMDTPKAAAEATGESIRSELNEQSEISTDTTRDNDEEVTLSTPVVDDKEEFGKGVVFYLKEKKIVGIVLWNIFGQMPLARRIISDSKEHEDLNATASLFKIHT